MMDNERKMSGWILGVALMACLPVFDGFASEEVNRVRNGGFEEPEGKSAAVISGGWIRQGATSSIVTGQEGKDVYRGKQCLLIKTTDKAVTLYQENTGVPGIKYGYRFAVRGNGSFSVRFFENNEKGNCGSPLLVGDKAGLEWKEYSGEFQTTNPETKNFSIVIGADAGSEIYFDEISVWEIKK